MAVLLLAREWETCSGQRTGAGGAWAKGPSPKSGQRRWPGTGRAAPGYSSAGGTHRRRKGGRAGDVLCGHSNENIIPDGRDVMGTLQTPQTKTARGGKKGSQIDKGK